jgi:Family of unknown function (DUF5681)
MNDDEDDEKKWPVAYSPSPLPPERTPEGRFPKGMSGNPSGRPLNARTKFSKELVEAFADHFSTNGAAAIQRCYEEKPDVYLSLAMRLVPQEFKIEAARALDEMSDDELIAVVIAAKKK